MYYYFSSSFLPAFGQSSRFKKEYTAYVKPSTLHYTRITRERKRLSAENPTQKFASAGSGPIRANVQRGPHCYPAPLLTIRLGSVWFGYTKTGWRWSGNVFESTFTWTPQNYRRRGYFLLSAISFTPVHLPAHPPFILIETQAISLRRLPV